MSHLRSRVIDALALVRVFFGWHWRRGVRDVRCAEVTLAREARVTYGKVIDMRFITQMCPVLDHCIRS